MYLLSDGFLNLENGSRFGSVETPVLAGVWLVEGAGTRCDVAGLPEGARAAAAAGAGLGLLWKVHNLVCYSECQEDFLRVGWLVPVGRVKSRKFFPQV